MYFQTRPQSPYDAFTNDKMEIWLNESQYKAYLWIKLSAKAFGDRNEFDLFEDAYRTSVWNHVLE